METQSRLLGLMESLGVERCCQVETNTDVKVSTVAVCLDIDPVMDLFETFSVFDLKSYGDEWICNSVQSKKKSRSLMRKKKDLFYTGSHI